MIVIKSKYKISPKRFTIGSAGYDLYAHWEEQRDSIKIPAMGRALIPTGVFLEIPKGYHAQVCSRSGLALKEGLFVLNAPGIIDSDYRGEVGVILMNINDHCVYIDSGNKIAQLIFVKHEEVEFAVEEHLSETVRGSNGFGSTDKGNSDE